MALSDLPRHLAKNRFGLLLASLFGLLLTAAFTHDNIITDELFLIILSTILCASLYAVEKTTSHFRGFLLFGIVAIGGNIFGYMIPGQQADVIAASLSLTFMGWVILLLFRYIFSNRKVDMNTIMGAACLYILIGVAFAFLYLIIDYLVPNSFHTVFTSRYQGVEDLLDRFLYYSFVTLTTLGYGDITPTSQPARYLSVIEALISQLYLTILLARLVGLHLSQKAD